MKTLTIVLSLLLLALTGCSSSDPYKQKNLELLADNRATLLNQSQPVEVGPLNIMRATTKGVTVELMMIYNTDDSQAKPITALLDDSIGTFCSNQTVKANLDIGLSYRIKIRNARGQLMIDELITQKRCK